MGRQRRTGTGAWLLDLTPPMVRWGATLCACGLWACSGTYPPEGPTPWGDIPADAFQGDAWATIGGHNDGATVRDQGGAGPVLDDFLLHGPGGCLDGPCVELVEFTIGEEKTGYLAASRHCVSTASCGNPSGCDSPETARALDCYSCSLAFIDGAEVRACLPTTHVWDNTDDARDPTRWHLHEPGSSLQESQEIQDDEEEALGASTSSVSLEDDVAHAASAPGPEPPSPPPSQAGDDDLQERSQRPENAEAGALVDHANAQGERRAFFRPAPHEAGAVFFHGAREGGSERDLFRLNDPGFSIVVKGGRLFTNRTPNTEMGRLEMAGSGPLLISVGATWCGSCSDELPALAELLEEMRGVDPQSRGVLVISDKGSTITTAVHAFKMMVKGLGRHPDRASSCTLAEEKTDDCARGRCKDLGGGRMGCVTLPEGLRVRGGKSREWEDFRRTFVDGQPGLPLILLFDRCGHLQLSLTEPLTDEHAEVFLERVRTLSEAAADSEACEPGEAPQGMGERWYVLCSRPGTAWVDYEDDCSNGPEETMWKRPL